MMWYEIELLYDEYCEECDELGIVPMPIKMWWDRLV
jgi:hypothetical protein